MIFLKDIQLLFFWLSVGISLVALIFFLRLGKFEERIKIFDILDSIIFPVLFAIIGGRVVYLAFHSNEINSLIWDFWPIIIKEGNSYKFTENLPYYLFQFWKGMDVVTCWVYLLFASISINVRMKNFEYSKALKYISYFSSATWCFWAIINALYLGSYTHMVLLIILVVLLISFVSSIIIYFIDSSSIFLIFYLVLVNSVILFLVYLMNNILNNITGFTVWNIYLPLLMVILILKLFNFRKYQKDIKCINVVMKDWK